MGLTSSLLIGQSALAASQLALQVTGNNIANVGTAGYHRQQVHMLPVRGTEELNRIFVGQGVRVGEVRRALDPALVARLRYGISEEQGAGIDQSVLGQIESLLGELSGNDVSTELGKFFNAFSELANNPAASINRSSVVEQGAALASKIRQVRAGLVSQRQQIDDELSTRVNRADVLLDQIASLNKAVVNSELGGGQDANLRDQRDQLVNELAGLMDVSVVNQPNGAVDILVGSTPVVLGGSSRGLTLEFRTVNNSLEARVLVEQSREEIPVENGAIGGLLRQRDGTVQRTIDDLDSLASTLIFEVNRLHALGRPDKRLTDESGLLRVPVADQSLAFNDPTNTTFAGLPFHLVNGSITVVVTDSNGNQTKTTIPVDLDGIDSTGAAGFADDTSLADLAASLNGVGNLHAQITSDGRLRVYTDAGFDVSFEEDSSGILATVGMNAYFQGEDAGDIAVSDALRADPQKLSVGLGDGTNETAMAIAALRETGVASLNGDTINQRWLKTVERTAVQSAAATTKAQAASTVRQSLESQEAAVSGVSLDEESINLINYQQQYAGAARFISVINELTDVLLGLV